MTENFLQITLGFDTNKAGPFSPLCISGSHYPRGTFVSKFQLNLISPPSISPHRGGYIAKPGDTGPSLSNPGLHCHPIVAITHHSPETCVHPYVHLAAYVGILPKPHLAPDNPTRGCTHSRRRQAITQGITPPETLLHA